MLVQGEHNITLKNPLCYPDGVCVFHIDKNPPVSFTCLHEIHYQLIQSDVYLYNTSVPEPEEEGNNIYFYYCGVVAAALSIMTVTVIIITIKC
ncbi:hypothetical protein DNTS_024623 [Danionella cerebrum]|uniref:Uncharacterized protein n=1 Tax=Danionella cerebrum TaxID=2873325 RepID=A0A553NHL1_9TELE|nr:hypothetical protein DNTS_024623 [Danionella translucida]